MIGTALAAFQVRIAYLTPRRRTRHYFHQIILAEDRRTALAIGRSQLEKRSPGAHVVLESASLRPDSQDAVVAILGGWKLRDGWWTRPSRSGDDLEVIARFGHVSKNGVMTRTTAQCLAIDRSCDAIE